MAQEKIILATEATEGTEKIAIKKHTRRAIARRSRRAQRIYFRQDNRIYRIKT